jgi:hypothetical protein
LRPLPLRNNKYKKKEREKMKKFSTFVEQDEKDDNEKSSGSSDATRLSLLSMIANSLNRYKTSDKGDVRGILMLIAALSLLSASDQPLATSTARRLVSSSLRK